MFRKTISLIIFTLLFIINYANASELAFAKKQLQIVNSEGKEYNFTVEIADDMEKQEQGLMFRKHMTDNEGMIFLFDKERTISMWMKNTYLPLDMVFIKKDGTISKIAANTKPLSEESISSMEPINTVLELKAGTCKKLNVKVKDKISLKSKNAG